MSAVRNQTKMLGLGFLATFNVHLLLFSYSPVVADVTAELKLTNAEAGFVFSASILTLMLFRIVWGIIFDRRGFKVTITFAFVLVGTFGLLRGFASDYLTLLITQLLLGIGLSAVIPAIPRLVSGWFPSNRIGLATGVCLAGFPIGDFVALGLTPLLVSILGHWRYAFQFYGLWNLVFAVLWWIFACSKPSLGTAAPTVGNTRKTFSQLLRAKEVWILTGLYFCAGGCYDTLLVWLPTVVSSQGFDQLSGSVVALLLPAGFLASTVAVGLLSDRLGLRKPFVLVMAAISGPVLFLAGTSIGLEALVAVFLAGFCTVGVLTVVLAVPVEMPRLAPYLSSVLGIVASVGNVGSFLLPILVGQLRDVSGTFLPSMLALGVVGECMLVLGLLLPETGGKRKIVA